MRTFKDLFSFYGRVRRSHFAYFTMISFAFVVCATVVAVTGPFDKGPAPSALETALLVSAVVVFIVWWVSSVSFTVRRLHDMSLSGWFYVLFVVAKVIPFAPLLILAWLIFGPGTKGTNSFGPDPRAPRHAALAGVFDAPPT